VTRYPLLCSFHEFVPGKGFVAGVSMAGRALATDAEDGQWWIYGVNPGAIAESGRTLLEAHAQLRTAMRRYLADVAQEAQDFDAFKVEVERFFNETDAESVTEWEAAVADVRSGKTNLDEIVKAPAESKRGVKVVRIALESVRPAKDIDEGPAVAA
jgi:hypothetical protein